MLSVLDEIDDKNDKDLFLELYEKYNKLVYSLSFSKLGKHDLAEECVQDTYLIVSQKLERFKELDEAHIRNLICTIARGKAIDSFRKETRNEYPENIESVDISYFDSFQMIELAEEIKKLTDKEQTFIFLKIIYGFSNVEISKMYGVTNSYVGKVINDALKQIKDNMEAK